MTISYISRATGPVVTKFLESSRAEGTKNGSNGSGHMTNMAAMPMCVKTI